VMVVMALRYVRGVVNAMRKPADGDIVVPQHEVAVLGTTSVEVVSPDDIHVDPADVDKMIDMCAQMVPAISGGRVLRAFAGSRPLYRAEQQAADPSSGPGPEEGDTREVSRTFTVLDHASRDGLDNMFSIVGGKLTTCRQMAEALVDQLADRMGVTTPCTTATEPLPGADHGIHRLAAPLARIEQELRRRFRVGYGPCQGGFCVWRAAAMLSEGPRGAPERDPLAGLERFIEERWRGQETTIWGDQAKQLLLNQAIYRGIFDLGQEGRRDEAVALPAETEALVGAAPAAGDRGTA
jgi:glycerol-3-phosphate dehydrogenase